MARFLQWLYTGDYECPYPTLITTFEENQRDTVPPELLQSCKFGVFIEEISR